MTLKSFVLPIVILFLIGLNVVGINQKINIEPEGYQNLSAVPQFLTWKLSGNYRLSPAKDNFSVLVGGSSTATAEHVFDPATGNASSTGAYIANSFCLDDLSNCETGSWSGGSSGGGSINTLGEIGDVSTTSLAIWDVLYWSGSNWLRTATTSWDTDTNSQLSQEQVEDFVGGMLGGTETLISVTYQDSTGVIDFVVDEASINHDNLTGFVTNEHLDWTTDQGATNIDSGNYTDTTCDGSSCNVTNTGTLDGYEASALLDDTVRATTSLDYWETLQTARTADDLSDDDLDALQNVAAMTEANGDILYYNSNWTNLAKGSDGEVLKLSSGLPSWGTDSTGASAGAAWESYGTNAISPTTTASGIFVTASSTFTGGFTVTGSGDIYLGTGTNVIYASSTLIVEDAATFNTSITMGGDTIDEFVGTGLQLSSGDLQTTLGTSIVTGEITDGTIQEVDLEVTNAPTDNYILSYDSGTAGFTWVVDATGGGGAFAWTTTSYGVSTSSIVGLLNGFLSTASSTIIGDFKNEGNATTTGNFDAGGTLFVQQDTNNVGINVTSPSVALEVAGVISSFQNNGEVRSYQTTPDYYISLKTTAPKSGIYRNSVNDYFVYYDTATGDTVLDAVYATGDVLFEIQGTEKMRVDSSGNIGIGDISPAYLLTVGNGELFTVDGSGNATTTKNLHIGSAGTINNLNYDGGDLYVQDDMEIDGTLFVADAQITGGVITGITDLAVADGGTGASTLTDGGILLGSGTGAITALGVASNGQIPIGDGATDPVLATLTAGTGIGVSNGAGSITISADLGTAIVTGEITDGTIQEIDMEVTNAPTDNYILSYDSATGGFTWIVDATGAGGGAFAWTETSWGQSTSTIMGFLSGSMSIGSTTITTLHNDLLESDSITLNTGGSLSLPNNIVTDAMVSNTLTASDLQAGSAVVDISVETTLAVTAPIVLTDDTISIDQTANFTWSGAHIFSGATLEIPNASAPTVDAAGEMALDTTDNQLLIADSGNTARVFARAEQTLFSFVLASTSPDFVSGGIIDIPKNTKDGRDITQFRCHVDAGTSVVVNISDGTNDTETITCATTQTSDTNVATNSTFTADELWEIQLGTVTGVVDYLIFEAYGYITVE